MFSNVLQPSAVSIFSSTSSHPLQLWASKTDSSLPSESRMSLLHDSSLAKDEITSLVPPPPLVDLGGADRGGSDGYEDPGYTLDQTVLHIQSPTLPKTYIQCPPCISGERSQSLGLKHPWMHLQVRNMGKEWSFEIGLVDQAGRTGVLRISTFQKHPRLKLNQNKPNLFPLLHLPLSFPARSTRPLTAWTTINLYLPNFLPYFSHSTLLTPDRQGNQGHDLPRIWDTGAASAIPSGAYSHVSYVRVYATCRLRRIWFDESGPNQTFPWELELYSAD